MFSLILIDDETFQLNTLKRLVDWENLGFSLTGSFNNSVKALEFLKNNKVDLVITDISMPVISGIDIARYLHQSSPDTLVIFLSAYEDFEYARQAITYKIFSYLVKPITVKSLNTVLAESYISLCRTHQQKQFRSDEANAIIRQCFMDLLSANQADIDAITAKLAQADIHIELESASFASISATIRDSENYFTSQWSHGRERLIVAIEQILNADQLYAYSGLTFFYENGFDIFIISKPGVTFEQFSHFVNAYLDVLPSTFADCLHMDISLSLKLSTDNLSDLWNYQEEFLNQKKTVNQDNKFETFAAVKSYIDQNYSSNISLEHLAADMGFSTNYFCTLFKDYFGTTFINYLLNTRIEAAKKLLIDTDIRITAISSMVGFSQPHYFASKFKSCTGYTPSDYRNKYRKM